VTEGGGNAELRFDGRVALVSGIDPLVASSASLLARRGAHIVVHDPGADADTPGSAGAELVARIAEAGGQAVGAGHAEMTGGGAEALAAVAEDAFGRLDIVVAGTVRPDGAALDAESSEWVRDVVRRELFSPLRLLHAAWSKLRAQAYGRVVLVVPLETFEGDSEASAYAAARGGLIGLMNVLKLEGPRHNIGVNIVAPLTSGPEATGGGGPGSATVTYLCHEQCSAAGQMYALRGDEVARMFIAVTPGYFEAELDVGGVRQHLDEIFDPSGLVFADEGGQEMPFLKGHLS
jgi:NAD(P)-dependent dehydrogenase (short-subunit alcohol dehydrogenase family)